MKVPLQLKRRPFTEPATALLSLGSDALGLLRLCSQLRLDPTGRLHGVDGGFLLRLERPATVPVPGVVRLRSPSANLYVPADAELVPALLDDEAQGLVQGRGLVFPPWGGVLSFDPLHPLNLKLLLVAEPASSLAWRPFPERVVLAERIEEILLEIPDESPDIWLESGEDGIGSEAPRPDPASPISTIAGKATLGAGQGLIWLGRTLGLRGLAKLGAEWVGGAFQMAPRLSEAVLGRQAAAIRALLREFREGDQDLALRKALPLDEAAGSRVDRVGVGDQLPANPFSYSLAELLGTSGRKSSSVWFTGDNVLNELKREYRKAAEEAQRRGDPRRAALIYGKLLKDFRMAAHSLSRAGLHHDAAILLLTKLYDPRAAAREFEAAGEIDRALRLYQDVTDHEAAGDLMIRVGEIDAALIEYQYAAEQLIALEGNHLAAGRLLAGKGGRPDLALEHYLAGWSQRPLGNVVPCLIEAMSYYAETGSPREMINLLDEVDAYHADNPSVGAEWDRFYHDLARLAGRPSLVSIRDDLLDRGRLGLAHRLSGLLETGSPPGRVVSEVFGRSGAWPASVIRDADFAVRAVAKAASASSPRTAPTQESRRIKLGTGTVTAACAAPGSDEVFVGFETGDVHCFRSGRAEVIPIAMYPLPVSALATSSDGRSLVVLRSQGSQSGILSSYARSADGTYHLLLGMSVDDLTQPWLTPILPVDGEEIVGVWDGQALYYLTVRTLISWGCTSRPGSGAGPPAGLLLPRTGRIELPFSVLMPYGESWLVVDPTDGSLSGTQLRWRPSLRVSNSLRSLTLSWNRSDPEHLEVAGLESDGCLHWAELRSDPEAGLLELMANNRATTDGGYLATALIRSRVVAGVTASRIDWLRCGTDRFARSSSTNVKIPSAVACFFSRRTGELLVVNSGGDLDRVVVPL